jgi:hypothetical protein
MDWRTTSEAAIFVSIVFGSAATACLLVRMWREE